MEKKRLNPIWRMIVDPWVLLGLVLCYQLWSSLSEIEEVVVSLHQNVESICASLDQTWQAIAKFPLTDAREAITLLKEQVLPQGIRLLVTFVYHTITGGPMCLANAAGLGGLIGAGWDTVAFATGGLGLDDPIEELIYYTQLGLNGSFATWTEDSRFVLLQNTTINKTVCERFGISPAFEDLAHQIKQFRVLIGIVIGSTLGLIILVTYLGETSDLAPNSTTTTPDKAGGFLELLNFKAAHQCLGLGVWCILTLCIQLVVLWKLHPHFEDIPLPSIEAWGELAHRAANPLPSYEQFHSWVSSSVENEKLRSLVMCALVSKLKPLFRALKAIPTLALTAMPPLPENIFESFPKKISPGAIVDSQLERLRVKLISRAWHTGAIFILAYGILVSVVLIQHYCRPTTKNTSSPKNPFSDHEYRVD